jgi:DNA segregation ATPase FtsK/SpoIIIE, S-DNA-T family
LLIKISNEGKTQAVKCLQAVMLRLLTVIPPGKARFTMIDPVGLGENFSVFMHLTDYDEALATSKIWTEARHIEEQLEKVTEHMEIVIQKYLRGNYRSIEEYNAQAGEVAEPYRFLVVANFPAKFSQAATDRLQSIVSVGQRCGVYVLMTMDTAQKPSHDFDLPGLEQQFVRLEWEGDSFVWDDRDFGMWPLRLDEPPAIDLFSSILQRVGEKAKEGSRVEVPFDFIAPNPADFWKGDGRTKLSIPIGRAGATKRQCLEIGKGTAQHVLIAGKTGSGKSTLLHALITNVALYYGPDEVELYLVDFKKGVEFKTYAVHALPHARVVAIESEREFGLSVLQRLDVELKRRGDIFREQGVQDLAGYRQANPTRRCPRILFIVDEFQEFFVENDRIATDANLFLDRLVRQGRAFGIHVILGSQTLGGPYSLVSTTIGQMAVRIALQCSEADAELILGSENPAARLLSRPGEAIYNDVNGLVEGNNLFQVVWLPEECREDYLNQISQLAGHRGFLCQQPQIVFEGNVPADIGKCYPLTQLIASPSPVPTSRVWKAWLGEAVSIKEEPTCAVFRPQGASNLLIVGSQEETAIGLMFSTLVSIGLQGLRHKASPIEHLVSGLLIDGAPADSPYMGLLSELASCSLCQIRMVSRKHLGAALSEVVAEINRRVESEDSSNYPTFFVIIHGLQYLRDLRSPDRQYSWGSEEEARPNLPRDFLTIIREGPLVGIHTILWCDSVTNLKRTLDFEGLREFEIRVAFQMGESDSNFLIDSPIANKLGLHRAYFFHEERGTPEKFRPYGLPNKDLIQRLRGILQDDGHGGQ